MTTTTNTPGTSEEEEAANLITQQLSTMAEKTSKSVTVPAPDGDDDDETGDNEEDGDKQEKSTPQASDLSELIQELNGDAPTKAKESDTSKDEDEADGDDDSDEDEADSDDELAVAKKHSRTWERRAKSNADRLSKAVDALKSYETELAELRDYKANAEADALAKAVADENGIPVDIVKNLKGDEKQIREAAKIVSNYLSEKQGGSSKANTRPALPSFRTAEPKSGDAFLDAFRDQILTP